MGWYDFFARFYDRSLEHHYVGTRDAALAALELQPGMRVLDLPVGTGQSLDALSAGVGPSGQVVGIDLSAGMLAKAKARVQQRGLENVELLIGDVDVEPIAGLEPGFDRIHAFLGFTAFPDVARAFDNLWRLLKPGGRFVLVDVHDPKPGFQGKMVNLVARADIRRRVWEPLEAQSQQYSYTELPSPKEHGGQLFVASGNKEASTVVEG